MQSPIAAMQRATYPRHPSPVGLAPVRAIASRRSLAGFGRFGDLLHSAGGAYSGASAGAAASGTTILGAAAAGSVVPIVGTAIGALVGLALSGAFNRKVDPEVGNFNNAMALVRAQGPQAVLGIQDKYLVLAGLFDLHPSQIKGNIPIYNQYGRKGEFHFVNDLCNLIQHAADQGIITANDTVQSVYDKVVAPWIAGFGKGPLQDSNAEMITQLLIGLIGEYVTGQYKTRWFSVGGNFEFGGLHPFTLPAATQVATAPGPSGTPTQAPPPVIYAPQPVAPTPVATPVAPPVIAAPQVPQPVAPVQPVVRLLTDPGYAMLPPSQSQAGTGYVPYTPPQAPIPTLKTTAAGEVGTGLPSWLTWGAAAAVLGLMLATARPLRGAPGRGGGNYKRARR